LSKFIDRSSFPRLHATTPHPPTHTHTFATSLNQVSLVFVAGIVAVKCREPLEQPLKCNNLLATIGTIGGALTNQALSRFLASLAVRIYERGALPMDHFQSTMSGEGESTSMHVVATVTNSSAASPAAGARVRAPAAITCEDLPRDILECLQHFSKGDMVNARSIKREAQCLAGILDIRWAFLKPSERVDYWPRTAYDWNPDQSQELPSDKRHADIAQDLARKLLIHLIPLELYNELGADGKDQPWELWAKLEELIRIESVANFDSAHRGIYNLPSLKRDSTWSDMSALGHLISKYTSVLVQNGQVWSTDVMVRMFIDHLHPSQRTLAEFAYISSCIFNKNNGNEDTFRSFLAKLRGKMQVDTWPAWHSRAKAEHLGTPNRGGNNGRGGRQQRESSQMGGAQKTQKTQRQIDFKRGNCLFCHKQGHMVATCPERRRGDKVRMSPLTLTATLTRSR
jgi:hypothetical protein